MVSDRIDLVVQTRVWEKMAPKCYEKTENQLTVAY